MDPGRRIRVARGWAVVVLVVISIVMVVGTLGDGGLSWLWMGLALVPVLLWLVRQADWHR